MASITMIYHVLHVVPEYGKAGFGPIFPLSTNGLPSLEIDEFIEISHTNLVSMFRLCAMTYFGNDHYTTRLVKKDEVWYHDGIETGASLLYKTQFTELNTFSSWHRDVSNLVYKLSCWNGQACE